MKRVIYILLPLLFISCSKEDNFSPVKTPVSEPYLSFSSEKELGDYIKNMPQGNLVPTTKSMTSDFKSLWQSEYDELMCSLDPQSLSIISADDLVYEPEDELILDPSFAKVLNSKREIKVAGMIYRYIREGVLIYTEGTPEKDLNSLDLSSFGALSHGDVVSCGNGISLMKLSYAHLDSEDAYAEIPCTKSTLGSNGITLGNGTYISESNVHRLVYDQSNSDANGFAQWISGIFGTNVVAINEFDSKHRISMRAFSQDYGIYRSVGMAVRMQQKVLGSWFRYKAEEIRYGWTGIECSYRYAGDFEASFMSNVRAVYKDINCYNGNVVFFKLGSDSVSSSPISSAVSTALYNNRNYVNSWFSNNSSYSSCPRGVTYFSYSNKNGVNAYDKLHLLYPQYEDVEYDDRREHVTWDFDWFRTLNASVVVGSDGTEMVAKVLPELQEISILRGEFYAAVKYKGQWKACVLYSE